MEDYFTRFIFEYLMDPRHLGMKHSIFEHLRNILFFGKILLRIGLRINTRFIFEHLNVREIFYFC